MLDTQVVAFTLVAAILTLTPGPDTMLVVRNVQRGGRLSGIATTFGVGGGLFVHAALSALGVSVILMHSAKAFDAVKWLGAGYLVWLGLQSLRSAMRAESKSVETEPDLHLGEGRTEAVATPGESASAIRCFREGFLGNVLNPKVAVFYLAFLPQFIGPADPVLAKSMLLASIHFAEGLLWLALVSLLVDQARRWFLRPAIRRWLDGLCGAVLVSFGLRLAVASRP